MDDDNFLNLLLVLRDSMPTIVDREITIEKIRGITDPNLTARKLADEYVNRLQKKHEAGRGSQGHCGQIKAALNIFCEVYGGSKSLEQLNEKSIRDFNSHLETLVDNNKLSLNSAHPYQQRVRTWIERSISNYPKIPRPSNLRDREQIIPEERIEPDPFTAEETKLILDAAVPKTKFYLLLMLNCAMYQSDIATIKASEVDWENGRIIRPRTKNKSHAKTLGKKTPFIHNWLLWKQTWELFKQFANKEGICFKSEYGTNLLVYKEKTRNDVIAGAFRRTIAKLKRQGLLPKDWNKTLKQFRKTSANLLAYSVEHSFAYKMYLTHSIDHQSYLTSGKPFPAFDSAITWLGKQIFPE
jgi:integrase